MTCWDFMETRLNISVLFVPISFHAKGAMISVGKPTPPTTRHDAYIANFLDQLKMLDQINGRTLCKAFPGIPHFNSFSVCRCCIPIVSIFRDIVNAAS